MHPRKVLLTSALALTGVGALASVAQADAPAPAPATTPTVAATAAPPAAPAAPPPPYSVPWQLRPLAAANVIRLDSSTAFYENPANGDTGHTTATMALFSYKVTPHLAPLVRFGYVDNTAPTPTAAAPSGTAFLNPIVGITYANTVDRFRFAPFLGVTIPVGQGGGDKPDAGAATALKAGINARSAMDNAMFAVNYTTAIAGFGAGYVASGFTAQAEVTLFQLFRSRGTSAASSLDSTRTNSTAGVHLGYFLLPSLSVGAEARYQRWLSTPHKKVTNAAGMTSIVPFADSDMDNVTAALGVRGHFKVGKAWLRPGLSYARGLDAPLTTASYNVVQIDVPFVF
ncbi:MAG TPA: hypothetical protein VHJ20_22970 [Polyangia bacterium]|nr:hypothetical protein [Polyangia bacterium]